MDRIDTKALLKVCLQCARELKAHRKYGVEAYEGEKEEEGEATGK